ncbi:MAG: hypothetical protein SFU56_05655 [Capsulimonadales bacterium]|nr:hypothetical protein [Capsulimonadales bacterium]
MWPFAVLFAGDMLCFDYQPVQKEQKPKPHVVERSRDGKPITELVVPSFQVFLGMLSVENRTDIVEQPFFTPHGPIGGRPQRRRRGKQKPRRYQLVR